ncbi:hypothetical protein E1H12_07060 [Geitlerinema sp. P-1104]|uniref:hypothetical protein n=1 Tax=Geitlerinema sp. P-1104 TaxID=2546230 RepID=UPI0014776DDD|nr:hypothetical protein [Geitlerinema sp. P-1104]NMG58288.1 hypothetical protein [Geitlerinema sp. P-1104]
MNPLRSLVPASLTLVALASSLVLATTAQAQNRRDVPSNNPFQDSPNMGDRNPMQGEGGLDMFDIIHRSNFGNGPSLEQFRSGQEGRLDNAADAFRRRQLELIRQQDAVSIDELESPNLDN